MNEPLPPEQRARRRIDAQLAEAGWTVQSRDEINLSAARGVAVREFKLARGHGVVDYLLFVDGRPVGLLEAKPEGHPLTGVEPQARLYGSGLPDYLRAPVDPLPFQYLSTGSVTRCTNLLDPRPRSRAVFQVHRPETLAEWLAAEPLAAFAGAWWSEAAEATDEPARPSSLRSRLQTLPPVHIANLWTNKLKALENLERSLRLDHPRALIQMATGAGKTLLAVTAVYRLIKYGGARRVLFLVDRSNLGEQAEKEFQSYCTPDDNRKFTELYNVQRLTSNTIAPSSKVVITTIQRLYSMLKGEPELDPAEEEGSLFDRPGLAAAEPLPVTYNAAYPPEFFDVVFVDECHRSIYSLWRQVLEYFDAYLVGLTATPAKHTYGFFNQNVVMEYSHEEAVADGVNVDFEIYRIRTRITRHGSTIEASPLPILGLRNRQTRTTRWERPDEDVAYEARELDRKVVARDQIRLIVRTFRDRLFTEIYSNELTLEDVREIGVHDHELERSLLQEKDLLVVEGNGSIEQIGRVALWEGSIHPCVHQNHIIKVRFSQVCVADYVLLWLLSSPGRQHIIRVASSTAGLYNLSLSKVGALPVALPPLAEQERIADELSRLLSIVEEVTPQPAADQRRIARLRQSILKWAFEGKLVDQDPDDEPASVLLERIRAQRQASASARSGRRRRRGRNQAQADLFT